MGNPSARQIFIDPKGEAYIDPHPDDNDLVHAKKITVVSPPPFSQTTVTDPRPLLKWQPLTGAVRYHLNWLIEDAPFHVVGRGDGETAETEFRLTEDTIPNRQYEWSVWATGAEGSQLGYWSAAYFFSPGGKEAFAKNLNRLVSGNSKRMPYIGITTMRMLDHGSTRNPGGITARTVGGNSPAMKAGLQPNDVLTSFNGKSLADTSEVDFVAMVRAQTVGAHVPIEYLRDGKAQKTEIIIEAMP